MLWQSRYDLPIWQNEAEKANEQNNDTFQNVGTRGEYSKMHWNFEIGSRKADVQKNEDFENIGRTRGEYSKRHLNF
jgi:hypothetical protein